MRRARERVNGKKGRIKGGHWEREREENYGGGGK